MARAIDKQTMLDLIVEAKRTDPETGGFAEWLAEYLAEHLPTITPPNEWVSVEERLPDKHDEYIVCACDEGEPIDERIWGDTVVVFADYYDGTFIWYEGNREYDISDIVTRWMPLPVPPDRRPPEGRKENIDCETD